MCEGGGNFLKYLKVGGIEKRGGKTKILKRGGGQAGSRGGYLRKGGWKPFMNHEKHELRSSTIGQIGKTVFATELLTIINTMVL